jgi:hypothetical protein
MDEHIENLLQHILDRLESDEYEPGPIKTVGGITSSYIVRSPYNTECEWAVIGTLGNLSSTLGEGTRVISTITSLARATFTSGQLAVGDLTELTIDFNVTVLTGGAAPTVTFQVSRVGADGILYALPAPAAISAAGQIIQSFGAGASSPIFGSLVQVDMVVTGAPTSITFSGSIKGKGPVATASSGQIALSASDPTVYNMLQNVSVGDVANGQEGNAFDGLILPVSIAQTYHPAIFWQPLGRGMNIYVQVIAPTNAFTSGRAYTHIAFRRKLDRAIQAPPRRQAHTHSRPQSRSAARRLAQGFDAQYPQEGQNYQHEVVPETSDTAAIGNIANRPFPQRKVDEVLANLRRGR